MKLKILITENLEVLIYNNDDEQPFIYQPYLPDQTPFKDEAEAQAWADEFVLGFSENG